MVVAFPQQIHEIRGREGTVWTLLTAETRLRIPVAVLTKALLTRGFSFLLVHSRTNSAKAARKGRSLTRYRTLLEDCLAAVGRSSNCRANRVRERVGRWPRAPGGRSVNSRVASDIAGSLTPERRRWEAPAPRCSGSRSRARERRRSRAAAPHGRRAGAPRSALAFARESQSTRRRLGGRGAARARLPPGGGLEASALSAMARPGRHRLCGDRPHRRGDRDRDQNQELRRAPPRPCP